MNKKHRFKGLMAVLLIVVLLFSTGARAVSAEVTPVEVSTYEELVQAIAEATSGDVISIVGTVTISPRSTLGADGKSVILRRLDFESKIVFGYQPSSGYHNLVKNITFDGDKFASSWAYVTVYSDAIFSQVDFTNCASTMDAGALNISNGEVRLNSCHFEENSGAEAGHILNASVNTVYIEYCSLKNGTCYNDGGAIHINRADATTMITNSLINGNTADRRGGGIANLGSLTLENSMLYDNIAQKGGADLYSTGSYQIEEDMDVLAELYKSEKIKPLGWASDGVEGVGEFLKLSYEELKDEKPVDPDPIVPVDPIDPTPTEPDPTEPTDPEPPTDPKPTDPEDPTPTDPTPPVDETPVDPVPPVEEKPTDPLPPEEKPTDPETPPKEDPTTPEKPADPEKPKDEGNGKEDPTTPPSNATDKPDSDTVNNNSSTSTTDNHSSTDHSSNESNDNTRVTENSNNTSTVNNYHTTKATEQPANKEKAVGATGNGYTPPNQSVYSYNDKETPVGANTEAIERVSSNRFSGNLKIDAKGVDLIFEVTDEGYNIDIKANKVAEEKEAPAVVPTSVPLQPELKQDTSNSNDWMQMVMIVLLVGVLVLQFRKPKKE